MKERQKNPDWIKGFAIVLMVYGHISHVGSYSSMQNQIVGFIYNFHMPIFLIISGFFFKIESGKEIDSGRKVAHRLILPYIIFITLYLLGLILIRNIGVPTSNSPPESPIEFILTILLKPKGAYWFIHSLVIIQFCFLLSSWITSRAKLDESVCLVSSIFLLAVACNSGLIATRTAAYFVLGFFLARIGNTLPTSLKMSIPIMGSIVFLAKDELYDFSPIQIAWCLSVLTFLAGAGKGRDSSLFFSGFAWLGRNSLIVLVLHAIFIVTLKPVSGFLLKLETTGTLYSFMVLLLTMAGCLFSAKLIDKLRLSKYIFGVDFIYSELSDSKNPPPSKSHTNRGLDPG